MNQAQQTIKRSISLEGIGVHCGEQTSITISPAPQNSGIRFKNNLFPENDLIIGTVIPEVAPHATILRTANGAWNLSTTEHLMAAILGLKIDNLIIEVQGPEIPILDGSALPFVQAFINAEIEQQPAIRQFLTPKHSISFRDNDRFITIQPSNKGSKNLLIDYSVNFEHHLVNDRHLKLSLNEEVFENKIAPARTFGFLEQLPMLRKLGLAKGTTLGNTVVIGKDIFLNKRRFNDECIRHKLLDLLGDIALLGKQLTGTIIAHKTGHNFNRKVVEHYINNPDEWITFE